MTYVIAQPCVDLKDKACVEECPVDCIYEGERSLYIHPDECVDCGACEPVCPVEAIYYEDDVPEQWKEYYTANVEFFDDLGSPGGAAKLGLIAKDHPIVAALPRAGALIDALPDFPWDSLRARPPAPGGTRAASSTSRSARPSTPRRTSSGARCATPRTRRGTRRPGGPRSCARPCPPGSPGAAGCPMSTRTASCRRSAPRS